MKSTHHGRQAQRVPAQTFDRSPDWLSTKTEDGKLVAHSFSSSKPQNEKSSARFPQFVPLAWVAANAKARELGWIG